MDKEKRIMVAMQLKKNCEDDLNEFSKINLSKDLINYLNKKIFFIDYLINKTKFFNLYEMVDFSDINIKSCRIVIEFNRPDTIYTVEFIKDSRELFLNNIEDRIFEGEFMVFVNLVLCEYIDVMNIAKLMVNVNYNNGENIYFKINE